MLRCDGGSEFRLNGAPTQDQRCIVLEVVLKDLGAELQLRDLQCTIDDAELKVLSDRSPRTWAMSACF